MMQAGQSTIELPARWAVLERALREMEAERQRHGEEPGTSASHDDVTRDRDKEDTRSRNEPVRPASGHTASSSGPRGSLQ